MREVLFEYLKKQQEVIIYGCGNIGKFLKWTLQKNGVRVGYMCDSNEALWYSDIDGIECIPPEKLIEHEHAVVLIGICEYQEVFRMLKSYKFVKVFTWDDVRFLYDNMYDYADESRKYWEKVLNNTPILKARLNENVRFKDKHLGKRCFIVGNGPSIREQDLAFLHDEITFTVNQIARSPQFEEINTQYHLWADPNFFKKLELECEGDYDFLENMKKVPDNAECFFPYSTAHAYIEKFELERYIRVNYYESSHMINENEPIDFTKYIRNGYTVVQYAIRLAIYMGFKKIYLLGCECTAILNVINARLSTYSFTTHCYNIDDNEKERAQKMYMSIPLQRWYYSEIGLLDEYKRIAGYCIENSIEIFNCTPGGLLDVFPRKKYEDIVMRDEKYEDSCDYANKTAK